MCSSDLWYNNTSREAADFEVAELIKLSANDRVIVDTNIPLSILKEIAAYNHVAVMLSPKSMSVDRFFDREDEEKQFLLSEIKKCPNPEKALENFKECIARVNSKKYYDKFKNSGFFIIERDNTEADTREEILQRLAAHFKL